MRSKKCAQLAARRCVMIVIGGVPLFTGFMYAAVGSYIARAWRLFDFRFTRHPPLWALSLLALGIYINFFTHHYLRDARLALFALIAILFGRCWIHFKVWRVHRRMPLLVGFGLVALFIWLAENIGTFTAAWVYPSQRQGWSAVSTGKLGAWFLLMIISYTLVALLHRSEPMATEGTSKKWAARRPPACYAALPYIGAMRPRSSRGLIAPYRPAISRAGSRPRPSSGHLRPWQGSSPSSPGAGRARS